MDNKQEANNDLNKRWFNKGCGPDQVGLEGITFSKDTLNDAISNNKLLNIQLAIPSGCSLDCIYCFQDNNHSGEEININTIFGILDEAQKMGVIYLQILGKGEPTLNKDLLPIIKYANSKDIYVNFFTCGDVIANDDTCKKIHGMTGLQFVKELSKCDLSIFIKYEASGKLQDEVANIKNYHQVRDKALSLLIESGFSCHYPTRLGLTPVILDKNIDELTEIYKYGINNNLYPHLCPLISTGKTVDVENRNMDVNPSRITELSIDTILYSIERGYKYIGPTPFPGGVSCEYLRIGIYIDNFGDVYLCSGRDTESLGNILTQSINDIWNNSYKQRKPFLNGHGCPWKEKDGVMEPEYKNIIDIEIKKSYIK